MTTSPPAARIAPRLVEALYTEAMLLADETRAYFDDPGKVERDALAPAERVGFACEALKGTTRLMQAIAWLLTRRAIDAGELAEDGAHADDRRLGAVAPPDAAVLALLPGRARHLLLAGTDLYERIRRADEGGEPPVPVPSPAHALLRRLERSF